MSVCMYNCRPFFLLIVSYSCMIMAGAVTPMMLPYFCKHIVQSGFATDWAPLLFTASAVLGMPLWVFLGSSYLQVEKKWRFVLAGVCLSLSACMHACMHAFFYFIALFILSLVFIVCYYLLFIRYCLFVIVYLLLFICYCLFLVF